jgi:hypothetical protein
MSGFSAVPFHSCLVLFITVVSSEEAMEDLEEEVAEEAEASLTNELGGVGLMMSLRIEYICLGGR